MTSLITNINELESFFPYVLKNHDNSWNSPCPFCDPQTGQNHEHKGHNFVGHDRMVWYPYQEKPRFYCRHCSPNSSYNLQTVAKRLSLIVASAFDHSIDSEDNSKETNPLSDLWLFSQVQEAHEQVRREYWYRFLWPDELIDRFHLGYGKLYNSYGHLIPMQVTNTEGQTSHFWYIAQRIPGHGGSIKSPGSPRPYYWMIHALEKKDVFSDIALLVEGEKDAITAAYLFPEYDVYASFGTNLWSEEKTHILGKRHQEIWVCGDHDIPGEKWNKYVVGWLQELKRADAKVLKWQDTHPEKMDMTDLLMQMGQGATKQYILENVVEPEYQFSGGISRPRFVEEVQNPVEFQTDSFLSIAELRGDGPYSIRGQFDEFVRNYPAKKKKGNGLLKLFASPPGTGKTKIALDYLIDAARTSMQERDKEKKDMETLIMQLKLEEDADPDTIDILERKLENFSYNQTAWFGQYVNGYYDLLDLHPEANNFVFNYEARHVDNCANFELVQQLGQNYHDIGKFCTLACPFRETCLKKGYLSQEEARKQKPIVYYRHPHLSVDRTQNPIEYIVIDENPTRLMDEPITIRQRDVQPIVQAWDISLNDSAQAKLINIFTRSIRSAMSYNAGASQRIEGAENPDYIISGSRFLKLVDQQVRLNDKFTLKTLLESINEESLTAYQPTYLFGDQSLIKKRCIHILYKSFLREIDSIDNESDDLPSCIHLVGGKLEIYHQDPIKISSNKPIIVLDATALSKLYEIMFDRRVEVFRPEVKNPNARTIMFTGGGFSKTWTLQQIGKGYKDITKFIETVEGDVIDPQQIPISSHLYDSNLIQEALTLIEGLAKKHQKMLVITHKVLRETLEWILKGAHPDYRMKQLMDKIAFAHFNQVRGTNKFKDYDSVLILGAYRIPYDVAWRKINAWLWHMGETTPVPRDTIIEERQFHSQTSGNGVRTFDHPFAREYLNMHEEGELVQCVERIRPHIDEQEKFIYVFGSRPGPKYITEIQSRQVIVRKLSDDQIDQLNQYLKEFAEKYIHDYHEIAFPPVRTLISEWGIHGSTARIAIADVLPDILEQHPDIQLADKYSKLLGEIK